MCKKVRRIAVVVALLVLLLLLTAPIGVRIAMAQGVDSAQMQLNENIKGQISALDLKELQAYLQTLTGNDDVNVAERLLSYINGEAFDYGGFFSQMGSVLFAQVKNLFPSFACIAAITLLCGIISSLNSQFMEKSAGQTVFFVAYMATLIPLLAVIIECFTASQNTIDGLAKQMQAVFPVLLTLMSASGGTVSAAIFQPSVAFLSNTIVSIVSGVLMPINVTIVAFSLAGHLTKSVKFGKFIAFFKGVNKWIIGIAISVFGLFFTVQGLTSASFDGVTKKVTQYALGSGVPIVGGFLSGGFDLAVAGSVLIKNSLGSMSIFLIVSVLFEPIILLVCVNLLLRMTAAITQPLGEEQISNFLTETADNLNFCTACVLMTAFLYFIVVVLFVCSAEVFV